MIDCKNGGKCIGNNMCRCPPGLGGNHCEIGRHQRSTCKKPCRHGLCLENHTCRCNEGWFGRYCNQSNFILSQYRLKDNRFFNPFTFRRQTQKEQIEILALNLEI